MARIKKRYYILGTVSLLIFVALFFLSSFTKNYLVKNSEKLIHRKLEIGEMHFNYAKVSVQVKNLALFEDNKTDTFVSFSEFYINFDPWTLLKNEYSFSEIRLDNPQVQVIQDGKKFNFDSMMPKEDSIKKKDTTVNEALKFTIRNIQLLNGKVKYVDVQKKNEVQMKNLNLNLPMIAWNNEKSDVGVDFSLGEKGHVNIQAAVDNINKKYQINLKTQNIDLHQITNYTTDYFDVQSIRGYLSSNIKIVGDMNEVINISLSGTGSVSDFSMVDGRSEKILSTPKVSVSLKDINLKTFHFGFGKIELEQPNLVVIREKKAINIMQFFAPYFRNDSIAAASGAIQETGTPLTYSIDTLKINNGLVSISDKTLNRPFSYELNNLNMTMNGLTESAGQIPVVFSTKLNNKGELSGKTVWSMVDMMNLEMEAKVKRMDLMSFSPYSEYFVASPITQGWLNYDLGLKMSASKLSNTNKVKIDELEFGKRTKDTTAMKVPVRLGLYLMKDKNDEIEFEIPVSGNPSDPQYKLGKIIWKAFGNMMLKAVTSPFTALKGLVGENPESLHQLAFDLAQDSLNQEQRTKMETLATILKKKTELILIMTQTSDPEKEKDRIAIQLTKKEYLESIATDPKILKTAANALKDDDPKLLDYIRKSVPSVDSIGIQRASNQHIDKGRIETRFQEILASRNRAISDYFVLKHGIPSESVQVSTADLKDLPQELRIPQFKIEVSMK
jgi:Domain of Unknown Function (DUF748)